MSDDRRRHERRIVRIPDNKAFFRLHIHDQWHAIDNVHDASISGMGIHFTQAIASGTPVKILFVSRDFEIVLNARIRWCQNETQEPGLSENGDVYRLGIEFDPKHLEDNVLMFMALRKYLDGFC
ncbi:MAG: PilZ domain-containing protein [Pseudomonadota bacterium]